MKKQYQSIWLLFPPNTFSRGLRLLIYAATEDGEFGIKWSNRANACLEGVEDPCYNINYFYTCLISTFAFWCLVTIYLDNILSNYGVRKPLLYFLMPSYWTGKGDDRKEDIRFLGSSSTNDKDVLEEENFIKEATTLHTMDSDVAVQLRGLSHEAVKGLFLNFRKNQLFCLLGPNRAGKTSAINSITGVTPVTRGDAIVYGHSILTPTGMSNIRRITGVCAQSDTLWDALSSRQHLKLFASIKGLPGTSHASVAGD